MGGALPLHPRLNPPLTNMFYFRRWSSSSNPSSLRTGCRLPTRGRGRVVRGRGRGGGSTWLSSRSVIPASAVPEELIAQVCLLFNLSIHLLWLPTYHVDFFIYICTWDPLKQRGIVSIRQAVVYCPSIPLKFSCSTATVTCGHNFFCFFFC